MTNIQAPQANLDPKVKFNQFDLNNPTHFVQFRTRRPTRR